MFCLKFLFNLCFSNGVFPNKVVFYPIKGLDTFIIGERIFIWKFYVKVFIRTNVPQPYCLQVYEEGHWLSSPSGSLQNVNLQKVKSSNNFYNTYWNMVISQLLFYVVKDLSSLNHFA